MGIGDELMMAGEARRLAAGRGHRYRMLDKRGQPKWHWVWEGNPNIARLDEPHDGEIGYSNALRPYIATLTPARYTFRDYRPHPAELRLTPRARALAEHARGAIVFNPSVKERAPVNKDWGLQRWKALLARGVGLRWIQIGEPGRSPRLRGADFIPTADFFDACGVMSGAAAVVVHEGALHHAAAALGVPAVVIRGGFISPRVTGYAGQVDFYVEDERYPLGCGNRLPCPHCAEAMEAVKPERVAAVVRELMSNKRAA
jgi:ADP-heptose:LPS heptosyltransferase